MGEEFWLLVALVVLIVAAWKPLSRMFTGALDGHARKVRAELEEAKRLREEAQSLLAEHQRKLAAGETQAQSIIEHSRAEAERQVKRHHEDLDATVKRRREAAEARIGQEESRAIQDLRAHAARLAILTTERLLTEQLNDQQKQAMVDSALDEVGHKLN